MVIETLFRLPFQNSLENSEIVLQHFSRVEYLASMAILWQQQYKYMVIGNYFKNKIGHYNWQLVNKQKQIKIKKCKEEEKKVVNKNKSKRKDQAVLPLSWVQCLGHIYVQPIQSDCSACVCLYVLSSVLWCSPQFPHKNYARSFLLPYFLCRRGHVLFTIYVFVAHSGVQHIVRCVFVLFVFVFCAICCEFVWIVKIGLPLRISLKLICSVTTVLCFLFFWIVHSWLSVWFSLTCIYSIYTVIYLQIIIFCCPISVFCAHLCIIDNFKLHNVAELYQQLKEK